MLRRCMLDFVMLMSPIPFSLVAVCYNRIETIRFVHIHIYVLCSRCEAKLSVCSGMSDKCFYVHGGNYTRYTSFPLPIDLTPLKGRYPCVFVLVKLTESTFKFENPCKALLHSTVIPEEWVGGVRESLVVQLSLIRAGREEGESLGIVQRRFLVDGL